MKFKAEGMFNMMAREMLPDERFNNLLLNIVENTTHYLEDNEVTDYPATAFAWVLDKSMELKLAMIPLPEIPENSNDKWAMFEALGKAIADQELLAVAFFMACEAWGSTCKNGEYDGVRPSQHPERFELISIVGVTMDSRSAGATLMIKRDAKGCIHIVETNVSEYGGEGVKMECFLIDKFYRGHMMAMADNRKRAAPSSSTQILDCWDTPSV